MDNVITHYLIKYTINQQVDIGLRCWDKNSNLNAISDFSIHGKLMKHCSTSSAAEQEPAKLSCSSGIRNLKARLNTVIENIKFIHQIKSGSVEITVTVGASFISCVHLIPAWLWKHQNQTQPKPCTAAGNQALYSSHFIALQGWTNCKWPGCSCAFLPKAEMWRSPGQRLSWQLCNWWSQWTANLSTN